MHQQRLTSNYIELVARQWQAESISLDELDLIRRDLGVNALEERKCLANPFALPVNTD